MLSRFAKLVGFAGGVAALVWAMRDRFISVAVSREPEPPAFRTAPPRRELEEITGVGPTYARRLRDGGFKVASDLLNASAKDIAEAAGVSETRAGDWIKQVHQFS